MQRSKIEEAQKKLVYSKTRMTRTKARNRGSTMPNTKSSSPWMNDCNGVTRRRPCYRARRGWARRGPRVTRTARRWRCAFRACRHRAPSRRTFAFVYQSPRSGPWAHHFTNPSRCAPGVRPSRRRTSTARPRPWIGGIVTPLYRARRSSAASSPILRNCRRRAGGIRCWTGEIDIRPSPVLSSDEVWRSASVPSRTVWISAWPRGRAWNGPASGYCTSIARCSTSSSCSSWLLGNYATHDTMISSIDMIGFHTRMYIWMYKSEFLLLI